MSVVLTGDVHHAIGNADQAFTHRSEAALAVDYATIAARHGLKVSLLLWSRSVSHRCTSSRLSALLVTAAARASEGRFQVAVAHGQGPLTRIPE